jgi:hypothetical protein
LYIVHLHRHQWYLGLGASSINEVRRISRHSSQGFCSISRVGSQGLCVWSNSLKGGAGNTYMPLHVDKEGEALRCKIGPTFYQKIMLHIE